MAFYTPRGLKIRLDPEAIQSVLDESAISIDLEDAFADVELWSHLPNAICVVAGMTASILTQSILWTLTAGLGGFAMGNIFQQFTYSPMLRILFPQFLGSWLITVPASIIIAVFLAWSGNAGVGIAQLAVVLCNVTGIADALLFFMLPITAGLRLLHLAPPIGDVELAFISVLDHHAQRQGRKLNWAVYERAAR
jgi:hypothetical protein